MSLDCGWSFVSEERWLLEWRCLQRMRRRDCSCSQADTKHSPEDEEGRRVGRLIAAAIAKPFIIATGRKIDR